MYIITCAGLSGDITVDDYNTAKVTALALFKHLNQESMNDRNNSAPVYIAEVVRNLQNRPELLIVAEYR